MITPEAKSTPDAQPAIILLAHGARSPAWGKSIEAIVQILRAYTSHQMSAAYLGFTTPDLPTALASYYHIGCRNVTIAPIFMAANGHVLRDLPVLVHAAQTRYPDLILKTLPVVGESSLVMHAIAQTIAQGVHTDSLSSFC